VLFDWFKMGDSGHESAGEEVFFGVDMGPSTSRWIVLESL